MKVVKSTGLVPVRALIRFQHQSAGAIFGVLPALAITGVENGEFELVDIPAGHETEEVAGPAAGVAEKPKPSDGLVKTTKPAPKPKAGEAVAAGAVEIPANWDDGQTNGGLHGLQIVSLAKKIDPTRLNADGKMTVDIAREVIQTELSRRAAAANPAT